MSKKFGFEEALNMQGVLGSLKNGATDLEP